MPNTGHQTYKTTYRTYFVCLKHNWPLGGIIGNHLHKDFKFFLFGVTLYRPLIFCQFWSRNVFNPIIDGRMTVEINAGGYLPKGIHKYFKPEFCLFLLHIQLLYLRTYNSKGQVSSLKTDSLVAFNISKPNARKKFT